MSFSGSNSAPTITGTPATAVDEDSLYAFQPMASDPDGDSLSFSIQNMPPWASLDGSTGRLAGTPDNGDVGDYPNITITVSDGSATASLSPFSITVVNTNDAPTISGFPETSVEAGSDYNFQPVAGDPDGDTLSFSIQNLPGWASFDSATGRFWGVPAADDAGTYESIKVAVSDGVATTALAPFTISVSGVAAIDDGASSDPTGTVTVSWTAPTARTDGSPLSISELAGYTVEYGSTEGSYTSAIPVDDPSATSLDVTGLPAGTYSFVVTARDSSGRESAYSAVVSAQVQ
ncbi:MAG: putative Ig domain-containing protein [Gammaproteobacteria bacterium]